MPDASNQPVLNVSGLTVELGQRIVLEDIDLELLPGEMVGLIGPNGAGKTTLLRTALGLIRPLRGEVVVQGESPRDGRSRIGYVPQRHEFAWDFPMTIEGAVMSGRIRQIGWLRRPGRTDWDHVQRAVDEVGLSDLARRPIGELSGGQRQRVLVARALATDPTVLLLDEPFSGVDVPTQELLGKLITRLLDRGGAVLTTTHDLKSAAATCTRLALLNRTVVATGSPEDLSDPQVWLKAFGVDSSIDLVSALTGRQ